MAKNKQPYENVKDYNKVKVKVKVKVNVNVKVKVDLFLCFFKPSTTPWKRIGGVEL
jgi:hypothetical protein